MADTHVISALSKKRAELLGEIEHYEQLIKEYRENLFTIDKTILIFEPDYDLSSVKSKNIHRNRFFSTGEGKILILEAIKEARKPLTTDNLADILAVKKSYDLNHLSKRAFCKSILNILATLEKNGIIERVSKEGLSVVWGIKSI
jgi:hypothetical protein